MYVKYETSIKRYIESEYYIDDLCLQVEYDEEDNVIFPKEYAIQIEKEKKMVSIINLINEAKAYLASTDYKMLPNYVPKPDENLGAIITKRNEAREFIRNNNA